MAKPWRIQFPGAVYHVMSRGNNRREIFLGDDDRLRFMDCLAASTDRFKLRIHAFCLMSNHYHLFIKTPEPNLSQALHWLNATYTRRFHLRHRTGGHLLQGRYKAVLVDDQSHRLHLSAYIHLNPVRALLVDDPSLYRWSSCRDYTRGPRYEWLSPDEVLASYGPDPASQRRNYRLALLELAGEPGSFWEDIRTAVFLGAGEKWERLRGMHPPRGDKKNRAGIPFERLSGRVRRTSRAGKKRPGKMPAAGTQAPGKCPPPALLSPGGELRVFGQLCCRMPRGHPFGRVRGHKKAQEQNLQRQENQRVAGGDVKCQDLTPILPLSFENSIE